MFEREHHRNVALVLQSLEPEALARCHCWFGGGTAMALRYGEYRESIDVDFLVSDLAGYRELRQALTAAGDLGPLLRPGMALPLQRALRADQYGIRTLVSCGAANIKFEIVLEGRIAFEVPDDEDRICGVRTLTAIDMAAEKLLANADRWADDMVYSRDLIDLAMQRPSRELLRSACVKAEAAYGAGVRRSVIEAVAHLRSRRHRLETCMQALSMTRQTPAQLWQAIRRVERLLMGDSGPGTASPVGHHR